ncbi:helix-turn-helix domain-containing protein [Methylobacterium marchantiae]|uniref:Helix-turn-helix domain-containing protein n=1 Tax=Methylobacterium marchantiae TaxID=600331 RepID=A0ABW3X4I1_9HYPH|nr:HTH-type transcriptional activator RhaR [Methylobacterium marchantiae]
MAYVRNAPGKRLDYPDELEIISSSRNSRWEGGKFQESRLPYAGSFGNPLGESDSDLGIVWVHEGMEVRLNGARSFSPLKQQPLLYMPHEENYGDWRGAARKFSLYMSADFTQHSLHRRFLDRPDCDRLGFLPGLAHLLNVLHCDVIAGTPAGPSLGEAVMLQVLQLLFPDDERRADLEQRSITPSQVDRACEIIEARLSSQLNLMILAQSVDMSTRHFTRAFRRATGHSPHAYITHRRLTRAQDLMQQGSLTLAEIAERVGFSSHAHMTATFRKILDKPPSHFSDRH